MIVLVLMMNCQREIRIVKMFDWLRKRKHSMSIGSNNTIKGGVTMTIGTHVQNSGWISADTPPDDDRDVWVSYKPIQIEHPNNKDRTRHYCTGFYSPIMQKWFVKDANRFPSCICEVTHWQDITPPKD